MKFTKSSSVLLNLIRGGSAQLVLLGHLFSFYNVFHYSTNEGHFLIQNFGVVIFFILSGCLIAYSVDNKNEQKSYKYFDFIIDRFSRIFISYFPALIFILIIDYLSFKITGIADFKKASRISTFVGNGLMLQDFPIQVFINKIVKTNIEITSLGSGRPLWTVAIEWWLYLFFGFMFFLKITYRNFPFFLLLTIVPLINMAGRGNGLTVVWFAGVLIYYLLKNQPSGKHSVAMAIVFGVAAFARLFFNGGNVYDVAFSLPLAFSLFSILCWLQNGSALKILLSERVQKTAETIAAYSFSLYLIHYSVIVFFFNLKLMLNPWLQIGIIFCLTNIIALVFARLTEFRYREFRLFLNKKMQRIR